MTDDIELPKEDKKVRYVEEDVIETVWCTADDNSWIELTCEEYGRGRLTADEYRQSVRNGILEPINNN